MFEFTNDIVEPSPIIAKDNANYTLVSVCPFTIREQKPMLHPGYYVIPPAKPGDISILHIGEAFHWEQSVFPGMPSTKMITTPKQMAKSLVEDFSTAFLGINENAAPGLFYVAGHYTKEEIKKNFSKQVADTQDMQRRWFVNLVKIADDDWARYGQHKFISDLQRYAAEALGYNREWIAVSTKNINVPCIACKTLINSEALVCSVCKVIQDPVKAEKAGLKFVGA